MQLMLQPPLMEVIDLKQSVSLPLQYILDNIVMVQETFTIFLKLKISIFDDKESWHFLFETMCRVGMHGTFIKWTKMLFVNAHALVNLNGSSIKEFRDEREIRQGCSLTPYLFLMIEGVFNHIIKEAIREGRILGIKLPGGKQQCD